MKQNIKYLLLCVIAIILSGWVGYRCGYRYASENIQPELIPVHDTIPGKIPEPIVKYREVPARIDTAAILAEFYAEKRYHDTIINKPYLKIELLDLVSQNKLLDRTIVYDYQPPKVYSNALLVGAMLGHRHQSLYLGYRRRTWEFRAGYDLYNRAFIVGVSKDLWQW